MKISAITLDNIPLIIKGQNISELICKHTKLENNDIIVLASTIISKSEGLVIDPVKIIPSQEANRISKKTGMDPAFVQAVLDQSLEIILESPIFLVRHISGNICINAGIDQSNVESGLLLLPADPDKSALKIKHELFRLAEKRVSVIITDTNGRAFREGQTGFALGVAGMDTHHDWRGSTDLYGRVLEVANEAVVDELAAFGNCMMGEGDWGTPIVILRGFKLYSEKNGVKTLHRSPDIDIIRTALLHYKNKN